MNVVETRGMLQTMDEFNRLLLFPWIVKLDLLNQITDIVVKAGRKAV